MCLQKVAGILPMVLFGAAKPANSKWGNLPGYVFALYRVLTGPPCPLAPEPRQGASGRLLHWRPLTLLGHTCYAI